MKASELMVGDYVNYRGQIIKVTSIYDKGCSNEVGWSDKESVWVNADNVEPIALTPEILEKNGFTRPNVRVQYFAESTDYYDVDIHEITDSIWCFEYQNCEAHFPPCLILIAHVHEFQHALRLCGIEKEIVL